MTNIINKQLVNQVIFASVYSVFSIFMLILTRDGLSVWMGINAGFAMVALMLVTILKNRQVQTNYNNDVLSILLLLMFIFFLPNTFYTITDLIHLNSNEFYHVELYTGTTYRHIIDPYLMLSHILFTLLIGIYTGVESLSVFYSIIKKRVDKTGGNYFIMFSIVVLSSVGIFIGRFLRLFSWDVLNPLKVIKMFIESISGFSIAFIILFIFLQGILFIGYQLLFKKKKQTLL